MLLASDWWVWLPLCESRATKGRTYHVPERGSGKAVDPKTQETSCNSARKSVSQSVNTTTLLPRSARCLCLSVGVRCHARAARPPYILPRYSRSPCSMPVQLSQHPCSMPGQLGRHPCGAPGRGGGRGEGEALTCGRWWGHGQRRVRLPLSVCLARRSARHSATRGAPYRGPPESCALTSRRAQGKGYPPALDSQRVRLTPRRLSRDDGVSGSA